MKEQSDGNKVENFFGVPKEEEKKYDENSEQN